LRGVLIEAHDEWQVSDRGYLSEGSVAQLQPKPSKSEEVAQPALSASWALTLDLGHVLVG